MFHWTSSFVFSVLHSLMGVPTGPPTPCELFEKNSVLYVHDLDIAQLFDVVQLTQLAYSKFDVLEKYFTKARTPVHLVKYFSDENDIRGMLVTHESMYRPKFCTKRRVGWCKCTDCTGSVPADRPLKELYICYAGMNSARDVINTLSKPMFMDVSSIF